MQSFKRIFEAISGTSSDKRLKRIRPVLHKINLLVNSFSSLTDYEIRGEIEKLKNMIASGQATLESVFCAAVALAILAIKRVLHITPFDVQIMGSVILHEGAISEMKTGEGKTLVAVMTACANSLEGHGVHIVTANDYLAKRDSEWMKPVYNCLGLKVGAILNEDNDSKRRDKYLCDVTYGTNNEFGFDYLRDNMVIDKNDKVQRGQNFAIIDEVDSILIDEARTPLIISGMAEKSTSFYMMAEKFVKTLKWIKIKEVNDKEGFDEEFNKYDYIVEEKARTSILTERGIKKAEKFFGLENLSDISNMTISHHINQAIKAHGNMKKDIDYVIKNGQIVIVDEFTGRLMQGRRYSDGLHQAIEAKENVRVQNESKTLATITFQNYFRMYKKLSGMTGTAQTEEAEFREIYRLEVVKIPTNKPLIRIDKPDIIYKTEKAKFCAVVEEIEKIYKTGQPILIGTISIEKSEFLSENLKKKGIKHNVLNAKFHEKEAEIIAQAGRKYAVTIATNMAGRGTDIILGGNSEFLAKKEMKRIGYSDSTILNIANVDNQKDKNISEAKEKFKELNEYFEKQVKAEQEEVKTLGGLYVIGTERHESRRIDNQLRGRSGRQGDAGCSRFYLSLEDGLMRLFGSEKIANVMNILGIDDNEAIENRMVSNAIENAQKKVESHNFDVRKHVIQYDDVNNKQREIIYKQRNLVLDGKDIKENIINMFQTIIEKIVYLFTGGDQRIKNWNLLEMRKYFENIFFETQDSTFEVMEASVKKKALNIEELRKKLLKIVKEKYKEREEIFGERIREIERAILLRNVDEKWVLHIDNMEQLKQGIHLRGYAQKDPVVEYKFEGMNMFDEMIYAIKEDTVKCLFGVKIKEQINLPVTFDNFLVTGSKGSDITGSESNTPPKLGRNAPCPCGSGKKFKNCCMDKDEDN